MIAHSRLSAAAKRLKSLLAEETPFEDETELLAGYPKDFANLLDEATGISIKEIEGETLADAGQFPLFALIFGYSTTGRTIIEAALGSIIGQGAGFALLRFGNGAPLTNLELGIGGRRGVCTRNDGRNHR